MQQPQALQMFSFQFEDETLTIANLNPVQLRLALIGLRRGARQPRGWL